MSLKRGQQTCYMCEKAATSKEHVPPQCFFPDAKDLPANMNLKKNLITVPSCDEHNTNKSKDDEYLLFCLLLNIANNDTAFTNFKTKITRAMNRNPKPFQYFTKEKMPVIAVDNETGQASKTFMFKIDIARILKSLEQIGKALYFHCYSNKFTGRCIILYDFALLQSKQNDAGLNDFYQNTLKQIKEYFDKMKHSGENPEVFKYCLEEVDHGHILGMRFYGGSNVFVAFVS